MTLVQRLAHPVKVAPRRRTVCGKEVIGLPFDLRRRGPVGLPLPLEIAACGNPQNTTLAVNLQGRVPSFKDAVTLPLQSDAEKVCALALDLPAHLVRFSTC